MYVRKVVKICNMGYQSKALDILHRLIPIIVVSEKKFFFVILSYLEEKNLKGLINALKWELFGCHGLVF